MSETLGGNSIAAGSLLTMIFLSSGRELMALKIRQWFALLETR
jgi:hypothetical protein